MYEILLTKNAQRFYEQADTVLVKKLNRCFDQLSDNPSYHPNIKLLKGLLAGHYRYRLGDWRAIYKINEKKKQVIILLIVHRKDAYR
ncbi:type II toxin-antitoxin system RelE/ParE family toxin [candidate division KSB1 bacterium]|nr:type II toxin-antitoxin system RelE/ParE family toxin [candidate division KSB1 bacterium]